MLVVAVIIYATWVPKPVPDDSIPPIPHIDKLIHAVMFGGLAGALMFDYYRSKIFRNGRPLLTWRAIIAFACGAAAFAVVDEVVQGLLDIGRPSDPLDLLADWFGILVAVLTAPPLLRRIFAKK